jgi:hypothetical protein
MQTFELLGILYKVKKANALCKVTSVRLPMVYYQRLNPWTFFKIRVPLNAAVFSTDRFTDFC